MPCDMHIDHTRGFPQEMIVNRCLFDAILLELQHDGFDFLLGQNKVAHHHRLISHFLEGDPGNPTQAQGLPSHLLSQPSCLCAAGRTYRHPPAASARIVRELSLRVSRPRWNRLVLGRKYSYMRANIRWPSILFVFSLDPPSSMQSSDRVLRSGPSLGAAVRRRGCLAWPIPSESG